MTEQDSEKKELRERVEKLESTVQKMMPSRRDAIKMAGAGALGAAAFSGSGSAGTGQAGTIGTAASPVDVEAEDVTVSDTTTTQDLVVNGNVTGVGGPSVFLESGDSISTHTINLDVTSQSLIDLYNSSPTTVIGGAVSYRDLLDFQYTFSDDNTLNMEGGDGYDQGPSARAADNASFDIYSVAFLPPALEVTRVQVGNSQLNSSRMGAILYTLD